MKFARVTTMPNKSEVDQTKAGIDLWYLIFDGVFLPLVGPKKSELELFDVLHVNIMPIETNVISEIRRKIGFNTNTKIVANIDYAIDEWENKYGNDILSVWRNLDQADYIFHVEPFGALAIEIELKRKVFVLPHPINIEWIRGNIGMGKAENGLAVFYHHTDNYQNWMIPSMAARSLNIEPAALFGWAGIITSDQTPAAFYHVYPFTKNVKEYLTQLATYHMATDLSPLRRYGRAVIECAALGIPCVVSDTIYAKMLYENTTVNPYNVPRVKKLFEQLMNDPVFYNETAHAAFGKAEYFGLKESKKRFLKMVEMGEDNE